MGVVGDTTRWMAGGGLSTTECKAMAALSRFSFSLVPVLGIATVLLSGCPQEPKTSVELLDKCREIVNMQAKERLKDLEGEAAPTATPTPGVGGKQGRMLKLCDRKSGQARTACIEQAEKWTTDHLKKVQDDLDNALTFCTDFIDKHKEFDSAAED